MNLAQAAKSLFLKEFIDAFFMSMRYFFAPKATINYPFEKGPVRFLSAPSASRRFCILRNNGRPEVAVTDRGGSNGPHERDSG